MKRLLLLALLLPLTVFAQSSQVNLAALASKLVTPGIVPLTAGGTGVTTAAAAINQLLPSQTGQSGTCLGTNGSSPSWVMCGSGITQLTGDVTAGPGTGSQAATVVKVNGASVPASQGCIGTNSSSQIVTGTCSGTVTDGSGTTTASQFLLSTTTAHTYAVSTPAQAIGALTSGTPNAQTGTSYTLAIGDANGEVTMANASANTLTVPTNASVAYNIGTVITVQQLSTGLTTVSPASGVTIQSAAFGSSATQGYPLGGEFGLIQLQKAATNTWNVIAYQPGPGTFAVSGTCTTPTSQTGTATAGSMVMASAGNCTIIITPTGVLPPAHGWTGNMGDSTQPTLPTWRPTSTTTTAVTFTVPTAAVSSDGISFGPLAAY